MKLFKMMLQVSLMIVANIVVISAGSHTIGKKQWQQYKPLKVNEGRKPISLKLAKLSDTNLAKTVKYFDIKQYDISGKYVGGWSFDMAAYKKLSTNDKKKIRSAMAKKPKHSFWKYSFNDGAVAGFYNLHYIDSHSKVQTINSRKDLLSFLGTVDTPSELSMLLLGDIYGKIRYRKIGNIYNLRSSVFSFSDCDGCGEPACTLFVRQIIIDHRGDILLDRQVSEKSFKSEKKCRRF